MRMLMQMKELLYDFVHYNLGEVHGQNKANRKQKRRSKMFVCFFHIKLLIYHILETLTRQ
jgi:hypothetical protein